MPEEYWKIFAVVEEANSDLEAQRIAVVASRDPFAALAMTENSTYLLPDAATGLRNKLSPEVERLERQAAAEAEKEAALMSDAPAEVSGRQLREVSLRLL